MDRTPTAAIGSRKNVRNQFDWSERRPVTANTASTATRPFHTKQNNAAASSFPRNTVERMISDNRAALEKDGIDCRTINCKFKQLIVETLDNDDVRKEEKPCPDEITVAVENPIAAHLRIRHQGAGYCHDHISAPDE